MEFFKSYFGTEFKVYQSGEMAVKCPFPHTDAEGNRYYETNPSAHINIEKDLFHCKVCGQGLSEVAFLAKLQGLSYRDALIVLDQMQEADDDEWAQFRKNYLNSDAPQKMAEALGITSVAEDLQLGYEGEGISYPVKIYDKLLDVRTYNPEAKHKVMSRAKTKNLLLPFDLWIDDERDTIICAGEKDMAIARVYGFNAITFTGGERAFPKLWKASFKGKRCFIPYDNDSAGIEGARVVAAQLRDAGAIPYVVTGHHDICVEKGEDIWDFFKKYNRSAEDLQAVLDAATEFSVEDYVEERDKYLPLIPLDEASKGEYTNRIVSSRVSVVSIYEEMFTIPELVEFLKVGTETNKCTMVRGEKKLWALGDDNVQAVLKLMDSGLTEPQLVANLKSLAGIPVKEPNVQIRVRAKTNVFKGVVSDDLEGEIIKDDSQQSMRELLVYSLGEKLSSGAKYRMVYKPCPHPYAGQKIVAVATALEESDNSINRFEVTKDVIESLDCFKVKQGETVKDKMNEIYERIKGFAGVETQPSIAFATELFYHTPLRFKFGKRTERAYLDCMIIGDPRTGKSQTAAAMVRMYELGVIISLKTTTEGGLIGGSDQSSGGWKTKIGVIPRNHKGAVILEEFSGNNHLVSKLTEVRSSNRVRLNRVNGALDVPAMVRMLSISNPVTRDGISTPLRQYPNGIEVLTDLVGASEDIARYDFFLMVDTPEKGYTSPLESVDLDPFPKQSYLNRVRWVWTRNVDQIVMSTDVMEGIVRLADELNTDFDSHIKIFGAEAWKKLARLAIAVAGTLVSTDETNEKIVVKMEHVEWARNFFLACYDNKMFKLREFVAAQKIYTHCDAQAVTALQRIYNSHAIMLQQLEMSAGMSARELEDVSGLDRKEFTTVLNDLAKAAMFQRKNGKIVPSERFRKAMLRIKDHVYMKKIGEV